MEFKCSATGSGRFATGIKASIIYRHTEHCEHSGQCDVAAMTNLSSQSINLITRQTSRSGISDYKDYCITAAHAAWTGGRLPTLLTVQPPSSSWYNQKHNSAIPSETSNKIRRTRQGSNFNIAQAFVAAGQIFVVGSPTALHQNIISWKYRAFLFSLCLPAYTYFMTEIMMQSFLQTKRRLI
jgi:hypothetical protein